jgi:hypothetical protein
MKIHKGSERRRCSTGCLIALCENVCYPACREISVSWKRVTCLDCLYKWKPAPGSGKGAK